VLSQPAGLEEPPLEREDSIVDFKLLQPSAPPINTSQQSPPAHPTPSRPSG
jgi:hypothetical protein